MSTVAATEAATPTGIQTWTNPRNGFAVFRLHYTADPAKRSTEWRERTQRGLSARDWRREYEIDWASPAGEPVFPEYDAQVHERSCIPNPARLLLRFWDFGYVSPSVLFAQLTAEGQLRILAELCPFNITLDELCPMAWTLTDELVQHRRVMDAGDPAAGAETDLGQVRTELMKHRIFLRTNRPGTDLSYENLRNRLLARLFVPGIGHVPAIVIDPQRCPTLCSALRGAFCRSEHPPYRPKKDHPWKDVVDALRYGNDNLSAMNQAHYHALREMSRNDWKW
jgi:hypothetical protein